MSDPKPYERTGSDTSEAKAAKSSGVWGIIALILGLVTTIGAQVADMLGQDGTAGIIVGAAIAIAGTIQKTLADLGYIGSRTKVKEAAAKVDALKATHGGD